METGKISGTVLDGVDNSQGVLCEPTVVVYMATNAVNHKRYIGVTKSRLGKRVGQHFARAAAGSGYKLHCAIRKHGKDNFAFEVLDSLSNYQDALAREVSLIAELRPEYNITSGGEGVCAPMPDHVKQLLREINIGHTRWVGRKHSPESIEKMRAAKLGVPNLKARGKKRSPEVCEKFRAVKLASPTRYWLGKKRDQATIDKIRATKLAARAAA